MQIKKEDFPIWFDQLTDEHWAIVLKNSVCLDYNKNEIVCKQGSFATNVSFVVSGMLKVYREYKGENLIMSFVRKGEVFGLSSIYNNETNLFSVATVMPTTVFSVNVNIIKNQIREYPDFAEKSIIQLNKEYSNTIDRIISLTQKQLNGRMADALLHFSRNIYGSDEFNMQITRRDMADFCGMSTESAIRILKEFHNDKIINIEGKNVKILSKQLLESLSEFG
ncbi:MAG: Crp/Fnr family transcriptional regulator [Salinivirgaceae bacterium]|nr:Crp/Fnr family transcriptional regulator [Salinivirgaceae bacterium]